MQQICSCIGSEIDLYLLGLLLQQMHLTDDIQSNGYEALAKKATAVAFTEGLLAHGQLALSSPCDMITFTHDSVNEAAYSLLEDGTAEAYHLELGNTLRKELDPHLQDKYLFTIASQLARGCHLVHEDDRIPIAELFKSAGEKSLRTFAFPEAHFFFEKGVALLDDQDWLKHYRLTCDLWVLLADCEIKSRDMTSLQGRLKNIFEHVEEGSTDWLNATHIKVLSMTLEGNRNVLDTGFAALRMAGVKFPTTNLPMHTIVSKQFLLLAHV